MKNSTKYLLMLTLLCMSCGVPDASQNTSETEPAAKIPMYMGKLYLSSKAFGSIAKIDEKKCASITVLRLANETPHFEGSKEEVAKQEAENRQTYDHQDMFIVGSCLEILKNAPAKDLPHLFVWYYHLDDDANIICNIFTDSTDKTPLGEIQNQ